MASDRGTCKICGKPYTRESEERCEEDREDYIPSCPLRDVDWDGIERLEKVMASDPTTERAPLAGRVKHYAGDCEPIDLILARGYGRGFCAGNVLKYVARYADKNGVDDLLKAKDYLELLIEMETKAKETT